MKFDVLTIFPDIIYNYVSESILKRAQKAGLVEVEAHNFRDYTKDKQKHVDDHPYGGGAGMVIQVQPVYDTLKSIGLVKSGKKSKIKNLKSKIIIMDPAGKKFDQNMAKRFSKLDRLTIICGRYQGFDERIYKFADERVSVGDYILSGGELPALNIIEAVSRLMPGVLGNQESLNDETFSSLTPGNSTAGLGLYVKGQYPVYTRPEDFMGLKVPKVLLSGDHRKIADWRKKHKK